MSRESSPTKIKKNKKVLISQDILDASNEKLVAQLSHKTYDFCVNQDMAETEQVITAADKMLQLTIEGLNRIFAFNGLDEVSQFQMYEAIEATFDNQVQYDTIKALSGLKRIGMWNGIDAEDEKYIRWFTNRVKFASRFICSKLDFITSQERLEATNNTPQSY